MTKFHDDRSFVYQKVSKRKFSLKNWKIEIWSKNDVTFECLKLKFFWDRILKALNAHFQCSSQWFAIRTLDSDEKNSFRENMRKNAIFCIFHTNSWDIKIFRRQIMNLHEKIVGVTYDEVSW